MTKDTEKKIEELLTFSSDIKKATIKNKEHEYVEVLIENDIVDYIYRDEDSWTIFYDSEPDHVTYAIQFEKLNMAKNFIKNNLKKIIEKEMIMEESKEDDDIQG